jgi:multidrug efflux pump subunit AcrA (membrane-fusion protein)
MSKNIFKRLSRKGVTYGTIALVVIVAGVFAYESIYRAPSSASASVTRTVQVTRGTVQSSVSASGNLSSVSSASENFVDGGTLATLNASVGQKVTAGQILATLDSTQASATAEGAESSLKVSQMNLTNAETSNATLQRNLNSAKSTLSTDESGGTTVQKDQNQSSLDAAEQQLTNDQNQLTTAQTTLSTDESNLATAQSTYSSDEALGCPPAASSAGASGSTSGSVTADEGGAPSVSTDGASSVTTSEAVLNATINTNGGATTYYFEYGTTDAFGDTTPVLTIAAPSGSAASTSTQVSAQISGLSPSTTYIFTVIASNTNVSGASEGEALTFTTPESSCTVDSQTITTDEAQVTSDENGITSDQSTITTQGLAVQVAQQNLKPSSTTIASDKSAITQDEASIAQGKVSLVQDQSSITQNELTVEQDEKALQETQLVALISGTITAVNGSVGQVVGGGGSSTASSTTSSSTSSTTGTSSSGSSSALISIEGLQQFQVVASFAEADAIKIEAHQTATITLPALPNDEIKGVVTSIAPVSTVVSNVVTYPVSISLISPPATLREGMTTEVSVIVQTASNVLELPSAAITTTGSISTVQVQTSKGVTTTTPVTLGLVGSSFTEITSGVTEGETIVEPQASVSAATTGATTPAAGAGGFGGGGHFGGGAP